MVLQILLWLAVVLLVIFTLTVIMPIHVVLSWQSGPAKHATVFLRLFGGTSPVVRVFDSSKPTKAKAKEMPARKTRKRRHRTGKHGWVPHGDLLAEGMALLRRLVGVVHIDQLQLDAEVGLGDPAETGQLFGQLCPLIYATGGHVQVRPNFDTVCFRGSALAHVHFTLIGLIWPFVRFGWRVFGPIR